jgi:succinate dehydrogenase / fumarate reductase flavoprotein subunit
LAYSYCGECKMSLPVHEFDAVVIGAGGAGMRAALQISQSGKSCALLSKVFPTRSHTVSAQGGITVALGNSHEDNWEWHMYDTVKGSDYIGDQDAIEYMCKTGPEAIIEMENMGLPFSRFENGKIYQRPFGGQSKNFGGEQGARTAAAADRTGHALLHLLYQQNVKNKTKVFSEWYALDLVKNQDGDVVGCTAIDIESGEVVYFKSRAVVLATGGAGRIYASTTNAHINTGDGVGMALRAGVAVQDMEMWQFHPTGIAGAGTLVTEGCRGEGGYLLNKDGERFMERYAPNAKDLAGRDVVARSMMTEIREGRGCEGPWGTHIKLKLDHLGKDVLESRLPGILELSRTFAHVDPVKEPIPVIPTCHYMMGGIPTNVDGQCLTVDENGNDKVVNGLFACGEIACVSVHGANRLGGNSLLDLVVFGRATGLHLGKTLSEMAPTRDASESDLEASMTRFNRWENSEKGKGEDPVQIKKDLQKCMQLNFSVFREGEAMAEGLKELSEIRERLKHARLDDKSADFNTQRIECLELDNLMETAYSTAVAANFRTESRGAHSRFDFPDRDDDNWLCHSIYDPNTDKMLKREVNMAPKLREAFPPKVRSY